MADNPSQFKPVYQTADVPADPTVTPASDIPKTIRKKEENKMSNDLKNYYLMGFKDGLMIGFEKGFEISEEWCPANTVMESAKVVSYEEPTTEPSQPTE